MARGVAGDCLIFLDETIRTSTVDYTVRSLKRRLEIAEKRPKFRPEIPTPIALVITDLDVGGAERALVNLVVRLDRSRWAPVVVNLSGEGAMVEPIRRAGIVCESLDLDRRRPIRGVLRLASSLRRHRPKLVQSFMFHANLATRLAAPLAGCPEVVGGLRVAERQKRWHRTLDRLTSRLARGSVCVSEGVRRFSVETTGLDPDRLVVIPNGVDPARFDEATPVPRAEIGASDDDFLALTVGRLDVQKGLGDLLAAVERVIPARPRFRLAIVGDGPLRDWLDAEIAARPTLTGRVSRLGRRDDAPGLMRSADLLIHAALWEGMPNVILEAMAARLPVVATRVEGAEELVAPGRTGWLVPPSSPDHLASAILEAIDDPEASRRMGRAGRDEVEAEYSLNRVVSLHDELWSRILGYKPIDATPTRFF